MSFPENAGERFKFRRRPDGPPVVRTWRHVAVEPVGRRRATPSDRSSVEALAIERLDARNLQVSRRLEGNLDNLS